MTAMDYHSAALDMIRDEHRSPAPERKRRQTQK